MSGFPNLFLLLGPNTGLGHTSVVLMIESQLELVLGAIRHMRRHRIATLEPRAEAQSRFLTQVDRRMRGTVWTSGGCMSWYIDPTGRNSTLWPGFTFSFRKRCRFRAAEYHLEPRTADGEAERRPSETRPFSAEISRGDWPGERPMGRV